MGTGELAGKAAIVTGAGSGIGVATARRFAEEGARVTVNDIDADTCAATAAAIAAAGGDAYTHAGDVSDSGLRRPARPRRGRVGSGAST